MDKHDDAAGLRLVRIGGKGTAWIFTEQAERARAHRRAEWANKNQTNPARRRNS